MFHPLLCLAAQRKGMVIIMKKILMRTLFILDLMIVFSTTTFAYLDPSIMTYTIQVVAGVVVAIGAVIGIYWRKAKKKVQNKLGIDEDAKKEVEADVVEITKENDIKQE